jgi:spore coat polysaccharide biosynthesis protein SpsF
MKEQFLVAILQARLSSARLPGKVLLPFWKAENLISFLMRRLARARSVKQIVLATSNERSDDPLAEWCSTKRITCVRGPLEDVAGRFRIALERHPSTYFVRINGDSPWYDPELLDEAATYVANGDFDIITNVCPRSYPKGVSIEILKRETFLKCEAGFSSAAEREHVTPFFYAHPEMIKLKNIESGDVALATVNLSVDTREDYDLHVALARAAGERAPALSWRDVTKLAAGEAQ